MSHLVENVGGDQLNDTKLNDLSSLSVGSPSDNQFLEYDSSSSVWASSTRAFADGEKGFSFWHSTGASWRTVGGSGYAYLNNSSASPPTELMQANYSATGAVVLEHTDVSQYNWGRWTNWYSTSVPRFSGCYVPAGTWYCRATVAGTPWSSAGSAVVRWAKGPASGATPTTAQLSPVGPNFYHAAGSGRFAHIPTAIVKTTETSTLLCLEYISGSSFQYGYADDWMKYYSFHITKIGN